MASSDSVTSAGAPSVAMVLNILVGALVVAVYAGLEFVGLRRLRTS